MGTYGSGSYGSGIYGGDLSAWLESIVADTVIPVIILEIEFPTGTQYYAQTAARFLVKQYKGQILQLSPIRRSMQQNLGLFEVSNVDVVLADVDSSLANIASTSEVKGVKATIKLGTSEIGLDSFQIIFSGFIDDFTVSEYQFRISIKDELWTLAPNLNTGIINTSDFPNCLPAEIGKVWPICYGVHFDDDDNDARNRGAWPTLFVDVSSGNRTFLIAAHAIKSIENVYAYTPGRGSVEMFSPTDYTAYLAGTLAGTTMAYINVTPTGWANAVTDASGNLAVITVNCNGKETIGDSTGLTIENPIDIIEDALTSYLGNPEINTTKFAEARAVANSRGYTASGGYIEVTPRDEWLRQICNSFQIRLYPDNNGRISTDIFEPLSPSITGTDIREQWEIIRNSFSVDFRSDIQGAEDSQVVNHIEYKAQRHWAKNLYKISGTYSDASSILKYGTKLLSLELPWSKNSASAADIAIRLIQLYKNPVSHCQFDIPLIGATVDLSDVLLLTHSDGIPVGGYNQQIFELITHTFNPSTFTSSIRAKDVQDISTQGYFLDAEVVRVSDGSVAVTNGSADINATGATSFITAGVQVGDIITLYGAIEANRKNLKITQVVDADTVRTNNTVWSTAPSIGYTIIPSWLTASASQKAYGHLVDEGTGTFSNGDHGFKLL
jgi:hypothetical protein